MVGTGNPLFLIFFFYRFTNGILRKTKRKRNIKFTTGKRIQTCISSLKLQSHLLSPTTRGKDQTHCPAVPTLLTTEAPCRDRSQPCLLQPSPQPHSCHVQHWDAASHPCWCIRCFGWRAGVSKKLRCALLHTSRPAFLSVIYFWSFWSFSYLG